jgi:arylsulfatase A-like enzyme
VNEKKPKDVFSGYGLDEQYLNENRMMYDEFILYADREFSRLFNYLETSGLLENTWVILTSDHGELFERGIMEHMTPVLYEPVVRIPLIIFEPGRTTRTDVYQSTSVVDVLPTLLHVTGQKHTGLSEGIVLPPFSAVEQDPDRSIYILEAKKSESSKPLSTATVALVKDRYKLMYFFGYDKLGEGEERIELYDLKNDPEELNNLYLDKRETAADLLHEIKAKLSEVNAPYQ